MPPVKNDIEIFYKTNILPSLYSIGILYLDNVRDMDIPLITQVSRISELILGFHYDITLNLQKKPNRASDWKDIHKHFKGDASYSNLHETFDSIDRIRSTYRNPAQHHYITQNPSHSEIEEALKNMFILFQLENPDICYLCLHKLFQKQNKYHVMFCVLYAKLYNHQGFLDSFTKTYKEQLLAKHWNHPMPKQKLQDIFNTELFSKKYLAIEYSAIDFMETLKNSSEKYITEFLKTNSAKLFI